MKTWERLVSYFIGMVIGNILYHAWSPDVSGFVQSHNITRMDVFFILVMLGVSFGLGYWFKSYKE